MLAVLSGLICPRTPNCSRWVRRTRPEPRSLQWVEPITATCNPQPRRLVTLEGASTVWGAVAGDRADVWPLAFAEFRHDKAIR
jgi:hypothetical protein